MACGKRFNKAALAALAFVAGATLASAQTSKMNATDQTRDTNIRAYVELLRSDLRTEKIAIITEMMELTEADDAKFWPIYRDYETQLSKINDDRITAIKEYGDTFDKMTDDIADRLARASLSLEERRHALKADVYNKLKTALSARTAARFLQVENQILLLLDLQIASSLPVVE